MATAFNVFANYNTNTATASALEPAPFKYRWQAEPNYQVRGSVHPLDPAEYVYFVYRAGNVQPFFDADECEAHRKACLSHLFRLFGDNTSETPF